MILTIFFEALAPEQKKTEPEPALKITYNLALFPASEFKKDLKKCKGSNAYFKLNDDEPFDTWKAQLLVRISDKLSPASLLFDDYDINFTIPRISPSPLAVANEEDYDLLRERVRKAKNFEVNIIIQAKPVLKVVMTSFLCTVADEIS